MGTVPLPGIGFLAVLALAQAGAPSSVPVRVEFDAPAGCSDAEAFFSGIVARASRVHRARAGETPVRLAVHLTRAGGRVHGELRVSIAGGESETRRVDGASCAEVVQVLSLTAALAIDPTAELRAPAAPERSTPAPTRTPPSSSSPTRTAPSTVAPATPPPASESPPPTPAPATPAAPTPPPPAPVPPPPPTPPEPPPPPSPEPPPAEASPEPPVATSPPPLPPTGPGLGAAAVAAEVVSSSVSLGFSVWGRFGILTSGGLTPSATLALLYLPGDFFESGDDLGVRWTALAATLCPGAGVGSAVRVEPCGRLTGGALSATDHSVNTPRSVDRWWGSVGALVRLSASLGWGLHLEIEAGADVPVVTRHFITTTAVPNQAVGATPAVSPTVSVGLSHAL